MASEFIGHTGAGEGSDIIPPSGPAVDKDYIQRHVGALEAAGIVFYLLL